MGVIAYWSKKWEKALDRQNYQEAERIERILCRFLDLSGCGA